VTLVRQTEHQLLALGEPIKAFGLKTTECLAHTRTLSAVQRQRLTRALTTAMSHHDHIRQQSTRLTHGKKLRHCKLVNAYDLTMASPQNLRPVFSLPTWYLKAIQVIRVMCCP
jgi:hypothetical protein